MYDICCILLHRQSKEWTGNMNKSTDFADTKPVMWPDVLHYVWLHFNYGTIDWPFLGLEVGGGDKQTENDYWMLTVVKGSFLALHRVN